MKIVESFPKIIKFFFTGCPNEKDAINVPEPNPRLNANRTFTKEKVICLGYIIDEHPALNFFADILTRLK